MIDSMYATKGSHFLDWFLLVSRQIFINKIVVSDFLKHIKSIDVLS